MDTPAENSSYKVKPSNNINLLGLDKNIAHLISGYLFEKDLANLCLVSKNLHSIFYPSLEKRLMSYFLKCVVEGCLDKVEEILNRNKKLVLLHGDVTDLSGRVFTRVTAFQYVLWAFDKEMWELILKYLPEAEAYAQLMTFEQERPDITEVYGKRFNFELLSNTYQTYLDTYGRRNNSKHEACWCKEVGGAQRQVSAWFVYVFCEEGEDKVWLTDDFKKSFTRDSKHLRWWFDEEWNGGRLGVKFGVWWGGGGALRGWRKCATDEV